MDWRGIWITRNPSNKTNLESTNGFQKWIKMDGNIVKLFPDLINSWISQRGFNKKIKLFVEPRISF
jgi:hypothetical protein